MVSTDWSVQLASNGWAAGGPRVRKLYRPADIESVIVGFGQSGRGLHLAAITELEGSLRPNRVIAVDPLPIAPMRGVESHSNLVAAWKTLRSPQRAIWHITVPPALNVDVVRNLLALGARRIIVEKPMAASAEEARSLFKAAVDAAATILPVAVWPHSCTTAELILRLRSTKLSELHFTQSKGRQRRTMSSRSQTSALHVEMPHQILLAMFLAGPVHSLSAASVTDAYIDGQTFAGLGGARVSLVHENGTLSELVSDLCAPERVRRMTVTAGQNVTVANYPLSAGRQFGEICLADGTVAWHRPDRPMTNFIRSAYLQFTGYTSSMTVPTAMHIAMLETLDEATRFAAPPLDQEALPS